MVAAWRSTCSCGSPRCRQRKVCVTLLYFAIAALIYIFMKLFGVCSPCVFFVSSSFLYDLSFPCCCDYTPPPYLHHRFCTTCKRLWPSPISSWWGQQSPCRQLQESLRLAFLGTEQHGSSPDCRAFSASWRCTAPFQRQGQGCSGTTTCNHRNLCSRTLSICCKCFWVLF